MGQDLAVIFVAERVPADVLLCAAQQAFAASPPENLVLLYGYAGPDCVRAAFPEFTAVSLWADSEESPAPLATKLSVQYGRVLAFMMVDHANVGAWQAFENGQRGSVYSYEGDDYTDLGIEGFEALFEVNVQATEDERLWFTESFTGYETGICVFGSGALHPGKALPPSQIPTMVEYDFDGANLECMLLDCADC